MTDGPIDDTPQPGGSDTDQSNGNVIQLVEHRGGDTTGGKLTGKQELFCQNVLKGMDQTAAYRASGYSTDKSTDKTVWELASRLFANPKVSARINRGRARQEEAAVHSGVSLRLHVEQELFALTTAADTDQSKLRALELLGKLTKVAAFTERTQDVTETLTAEEVEDELKARLSKAFGENAS